MSTITIDGKKYRVTETIKPSAGYPKKVKFVLTPDGEKVAVLNNGVWEWRDVIEKVYPLVEHLNKQKKDKDVQVFPPP